MTSNSDNCYSQSADEALINLAQSGIVQAETALLQRYRSFVLGIASKFSSSSLESDDIVQEGLLGLLSAIYSFSPKKKVSFRTYSAACVSNSIRTAVKADSRLKNCPLNTYISINDIDIAAGVSPEEQFISDENTERIKQIIEKYLSAMEKNVLNMHISGKSYREIAENLQISEKSVDNALQRVRLKLSKLLNDS